MMNACSWTVPSSRGHREIDVYVRSCARLLLCIFVCVRVRVHVRVRVSLSLFHFLPLSLFPSVYLFIHVCFSRFFPFSLVFSLSCSLYLSLCISVCLCLCVSASLRLCVFVLIYDVIHQILSPNLTKRPVVLHQN